MEAVISVICNRFKILKNGESPLMLRIAKDGKRTMRSLGISLDPKYWDSKKGAPKRNCPNKEVINQIIDKTLIKYRSKIVQCRALGIDYTVETILEDDKQQKIKSESVENFYK
jgi:hypothetical protein